MREKEKLKNQIIAKLTNLLANYAQICNLILNVAVVANKYQTWICLKN